MGSFYILSVFFHIVFAAFWIGGMLFIPLVLLPGIKRHEDRVSLLYKTGIKFRLFGWVALIGLVVTGSFNMYLKGFPFSWEFLAENSYGRLLGMKLLAFVLMLSISGIHDFYIGSRAIEEMQRNPSPKLRHIARWSGRINLLLALFIALMGTALSRGGF